jgi:hypothetical protein
MLRLWAKQYRIYKNKKLLASHTIMRWWIVKLVKCNKFKLINDWMMDCFFYLQNIDLTIIGNFSVMLTFAILGIEFLINIGQVSLSSPHQCLHKCFILSSVLLRLFKLYSFLVFSLSNTNSTISIGISKHEINIKPAL